MGAGVDAVKQKLVSGFGPSEFREMFDTNTASTVLAFESDGLQFSVRISREFDDDFHSGTTTSLWDLVTVLKASPSRNAVVQTDGISVG
jgi:hypothetical protein